MTDGSIRGVGIAVAVLVHGALIGGVWGAARLDKARVEKRVALQEEQINHIEAGLAIKSKSTAGRRSKQPQKDVATREKPTDVAVTRDDSAPPDKKDPKKPDPELDPEAAMAKARKLGQQGEASPSASENPGSDDENKTGRQDGSDFGLYDEAKGDAYLGELNGRVHEHWVLPSTIPDSAALTGQGCVRLRADGKIDDVMIPAEGRSTGSEYSPTFNSAVLRSLKQASDMPGPVPAHLKKQVVESYLCFVFRP
jgi:hypothetical protein